VGYFALRLLRYIANRGKFGWFAYYCWGVGALAILLSIIL
jgi:undecaprenyl-diphosphatase